MTDNCLLYELDINFCFLNPLDKCFYKFNGKQTWKDWKEFESDYLLHSRKTSDINLPVIYFKAIYFEYHIKKINKDKA